VRRTVSALFFMLILMGTFTLAFNIGLVSAQGETVYINADGSVSPSSAPIATLDNVNYSLTGNVADTFIVIERNNITFCGGGYTVQGSAVGNGVDLESVSNVTIENVTVNGFQNGIHLNSSSNNTVTDNNVTADSVGILLDYSLYNTVSNNNALGNVIGIWVNSSSNDEVLDNVACGNGGYGIAVAFDSSLVTVSNNNASQNGMGICVGFSSESNVVSDNDVSENGGWGIRLVGCSNTLTSGNKVTENSEGIYLDASYGNTVSENNVSSNTGSGISLSASCNNIVRCNNVSGNGGGIWLYTSLIGSSSSNNAIYHNNFVNNSQQAASSGPNSNSWDNGYLSGGNYWSDYNGTDSYSGPYQNVTGSDGIGDTPYVVDSNNTDHYPLMQPWTPPPISATFDLTITAATGGTTDPTLGIYTYSFGTIVNVTALPYSGYYLNHWQLYGVNVGYSNPITVTMDDEQSLEAVFTTWPATDIQITFGQTGIGNDFNGTVVSIDGTNYTASSLPVSFWWEPASVHTYSYFSPFYVEGTEQYYYQTTTWEYFSSGSTTIGTGTEQTGSVIVDVNGPHIITGNYGARYFLTVQTNLPSLVNATGQGWYDANTYATISTQQGLDLESDALRYRFSDWSGGNVTDIRNPDSPSTTVLMDAPKTVTANYLAQYNVTFCQTGIGSDCPAICLWVDGEIPYTGSELPASFWWDSGSIHTFAYQSPLGDGSGVKPYFWNSTTGLLTLQSGSMNVTGPGTVTGSYVTDVHQVKITQITGSKWIYEGLTANVNVTVTNLGDFPENIWVTLYYNISASKSADAYPVYLDVGQSCVLPFTWNTENVPCLNYTLTAVITSTTGINGESNATVTVRLMGDVNGDGRVDMKDIASVARAFGSTPTSPDWNPAADLNGDGAVNMKDIVLVARNFRQHYP